MVNNNQKFRKSKIALAVVLTMGLSACGVDGDEGSVSNSQSQTQTDATQNSVGNQKLTGTVTGAVFDTNGNPIAGAAVYLGKQETVTGAGGIYVFNDVPVVNVVGVNSETVYGSDAAIAGYDLTGKMAVTIVVDGYLGGTVFVSPQAQVNNTGEDSDTTVQTFVDGFTAEAGTAVLPALTAKVYGYLTDCSTDTDLDGTGEEPAVGVTVAFDVTGLSETVDYGSDFILAVNSFFSVATNANGMFEAMLPADSFGGMLLEGWYLTTVAATNSELADFNTEHEAVSNYVGTFEVCKVAPNGGEGTIANAAPMFSSIDGTVGTVEASFKDEQDQGAAAGVAEVVAVAAVAATTGTPAIPAIPGTPAIPAVLASMATYALLADGIVNDIVIHFSEALPNMTADDFRVYIGDTIQSPTSYTATLSEALDFVTLTFATDLTAGDKVEFVMAQFLAQDADGAEFTNNMSSTVLWDSAPIEAIAGVEATPGVPGSGVDARMDDLISANASYASARFTIFKKAVVPTGEASVVLTGQVGDVSESAIFTYSSVFSDNLAAAEITQLNPNADTTRLQELADAVENANSGSPAAADNEVTATTAVVSFEDAAGKSIGVSASDNAAFTDILNVIDTGSLLAETGSFIVTGAADGTVITADATNVFGDVVQTSTVTLADTIAPTTVLQQSFGVTTTGEGPKADALLVATNASAAISFGAGGEPTGQKAGVEATVGNPIIYIQPRHLASRDAGTLETAERGEEFAGLTVDMDDRLDTDETGTLEAFGGRPLYDATAMADWNAVSQNIGIAVSEDISVVEDATISTAFIDTALTAPVALNNIASNVDEVPSALGTGSVDLVQITIADVVALANNDHGGTISLEGVIQDTAGTPNVTDAASNAQVVIEDAFPPMVVSASWDGTAMTVVFNEDIAVPTGTATETMTLLDPTDSSVETITMNAAITGSDTAAYFTYDDETFTLVVNTPSTLANSFAGSASALEEFFYDDDADDADEQHGVLNIDNVEDTHGNKWSDYHVADVSVTADRWAVEAPQFLAINELGAFTALVTWSGVISSASAFDDNGVAQVIVEFSHPLDLSKASDSTGGLDTDNDGIVQQSEFATMFTIDFDGIDVVPAVPLGDVNGNRNIALSANGKVMTIDLSEAPGTIELAVTSFNIVSAHSALITSGVGSEIINQSSTLTTN